MREIVRERMVMFGMPAGHIEKCQHPKRHIERSCDEQHEFTAFPPHEAICRIRKDPALGKNPALFARYTLTLNCSPFVSESANADINLGI